MRVTLVRAPFHKPEFSPLDEPTNHFDIEAGLWLEDYLAKLDKILFFIYHSQDFMDNVCTNMVWLYITYKKLQYYSGVYDRYGKQK